MITRERIEEIQAESREKGFSIKKFLEEKGIPSHQYFWWKQKSRRQRSVCHANGIAEKWTVTVAKTFNR